jgi:predicted transcriptional regulator
MDREDDERRRAQAWREEVRRKIDEGFEEALRGELLDGEQVLERLRRAIESRSSTKKT